jgi:hypothetical protein
MITVLMKVIKKIVVVFILYNQLNINTVTGTWISQTHVSWYVTHKQERLNIFVLKHAQHQ